MQLLLLLLLLQQPLLQQPGNPVAGRFPVAGTESVLVLATLRMRGHVPLHGKDACVRHQLRQSPLALPQGPSRRSPTASNRARCQHLPNS